MSIQPYDLLLFAHVILFVYWLGPDWGVYLTCPAIWRADYPVEERLRRARLVVSMAQISRNSLILLLPVGLTMAGMLGLVVFSPGISALVWAVGLGWLAISILMYRRMGTPLADRLNKIDAALRWVLMTGLILVGGVSLIWGQPVFGNWLALKLMLFGLLLGNSMQQRAIARQWVTALRTIKAEGSSEAVEAIFHHTARRSQLNAYGTWSISIAIAFLGVTKPF